MLIYRDWWGRIRGWGVRIMLWMIWLGSIRLSWILWRREGRWRRVRLGLWYKRLSLSGQVHSIKMLKMLSNLSLNPNHNPSLKYKPSPNPQNNKCSTQKNNLQNKCSSSLNSCNKEIKIMNKKLISSKKEYNNLRTN